MPIIQGHPTSATYVHTTCFCGDQWCAHLEDPPRQRRPTDLNAISADGPDDVWIVGTYLDSANGRNETFSEHFNGTAWSVVPMPPVSSSNPNAFFHFNAIKANSPSDVWAVGDSGVTDVPSSQMTLIEHFNGTAWSIVPSPSPGSIDVLSGVTTSNASNNVWAVGSDVPAGGRWGRPSR